MGSHPFNHPAAVAAANEKAAELRWRATMLELAKLTTLTHRGELTTRWQQLAIRARALEVFAADPYPTDSVLHIGWERDRRVILDAGRSSEDLMEGKLCPN